MLEILNKIKVDLKNGDNIDIYISIPIAFIVAVLGILERISFELLSSTILLILGLQAASILITRKSSKSAVKNLEILNLQIDQLQHSIDPPLQFRWEYPEFTEIFNDAKSISILGSSLSSTSHYYSTYERAVLRGTDLRFLVNEPNLETMNMLLFRSYLDKDPQIAVQNTALRIGRLLKLNKNPSNKGTVEIRTFPIAANHGLIIIEFNDGRERVYVKIYPFRVPTGQYPALTIDEQKNSDFFGFFKDEFNRLWDNSFPVK